MSTDLNNFRLNWYAADTHQYVATTSVDGKSVFTRPAININLTSMRKRFNGLICINPDYVYAKDVLNQMKLDMLINPPNPLNTSTRFYGNSKDLLAHICTITDPDNRRNMYLALFQSEPE
jgi:hypothetical protein